MIWVLRGTLKDVGPKPGLFLKGMGFLFIALRLTLYDGVRHALCSML